MGRQVSQCMMASVIASLPWRLETMFADLQTISWPSERCVCKENETVIHTVKRTNSIVIGRTHLQFYKQENEFGKVVCKMRSFSPAPMVGLALLQYQGQ